MATRKFGPIDVKTLSAVERRLGYVLPHRLREVYLTVGNGGVGRPPLLGLVGGQMDDSGRTGIELYARWFERPVNPLWPRGVLPFVYEGCNSYLCVDLKRAPHPVFRWDGATVAFEKTPSKKMFAATFAPYAPSIDHFLDRLLGRPARGGEGDRPATSRVSAGRRVRGGRSQRS